MSGESPTRPTRLLVMPPVEVAAARWPCMSSATAPTVPNFWSSSSGGLVMAGPSWWVSARAPSRTRDRWRRGGGVLEEGGGGGQGVGHVAHAGNGAGRERGAVHHGRVELVRFFVREHR